MKALGDVHWQQRGDAKNRVICSIFIFIIGKAGLVLGRTGTIYKMSLEALGSQETFVILSSGFQTVLWIIFSVGFEGKGYPGTLQRLKAAQAWWKTLQTWNWKICVQVQLRQLTNWWPQAGHLIPHSSAPAHIKLGTWIIHTMGCVN